MALKKIIVAITGASGSLFALEFLRIIENSEFEAHGIISEAGEKVLKLELDISPEELPGVTKWFQRESYTAPMASGSSQYVGMVIVPCTMGSLAAIANGNGRNLIHRAADVTLKERRPLLMATRETPLNGIHLENMLKAHKAGAIICPPMPAMYNKPADLSEMARHFAERLADLLDIPLQDAKRWQGISI